MVNHRVYTTFFKVLKLNPTSIYASLQIGSIKFLLGHNADAIEAFKQVLEQDPEYIPALKGLGQALIAKVKKMPIETIATLVHSLQLV